VGRERLDPVAQDASGVGMKLHPRLQLLDLLTGLF
jgi:hypothetical protein